LVLKEGVNSFDETLPINAYFKNKLKTKETIKLKLNDSIYMISLDTNEEYKFKVNYRNEFNKVLISLSDVELIINDTISINTRIPGQISIEIDNPKDDLGFLWSVDSTNIKNYYFYISRIKEQKEKRIKFAVWGQFIE